MNIGAKIHVCSGLAIFENKSFWFFCVTFDFGSEAVRSWFGLGSGCDLQLGFSLAEKERHCLDPSFKAPTWLQPRDKPQRTLQIQIENLSFQH